MNALDKLGLAIANAGYTWTPEMREAYEKGSKKQWVGLTDMEISKVWQDTDLPAGQSIHAYARAIEAKLKEKNT